MVVFHKTSGNPQQIWHKEALQHDKPGSERALVQRRFMGNKALPEEKFYAAGSNIFLPLRWTWNLKGLP